MFKKRGNSTVKGANNIFEEKDINGTTPFPCTTSSLCPTNKVK